MPIHSNYQFMTVNNITSILSISTTQSTMHITQFTAKTNKTITTTYHNHNIKQILTSTYSNQIIIVYTNGYVSIHEDSLPNKLRMYNDYVQDFMYAKQMFMLGKGIVVYAEEEDGWKVV